MTAQRLTGPNLGFCCRAQGKLVGRLNDMCLPQPIDDCLRVLGDTLCHHAAIPPTISIHAARNFEHAVRSRSFAHGVSAHLRCMSRLKMCAGVILCRAGSERHYICSVLLVTPT